MIDRLKRFARTAWAWLCWAAQVTHRWAVAIFVPVATSVKGKLDLVDCRSIGAKIVTISLAAGGAVKVAGREALKDPEIVGTLVMLAVGIAVGLLEALTRHQTGAEPTPTAPLSPSPPTATTPPPQPQAPGGPPA